MNQEKDKLFIFDLGNVVIKNIECLSKIARHYNISYDMFLSYYKKYEDDLMIAKLEPSLFWKLVEKEFKIRIKGEPFNEFFTPFLNDEIIDLIMDLKVKKYRIVLGSNTFAPHFTKELKVKISYLFDAMYASHEIKKSKPNLDFYNHILNNESYLPKDTFFIDDLKENIDAALKCNINAFLYQDNIEELRAFIKKKLK